MINEVQTTVNEIEGGTLSFNGIDGVQAIISGWEYVAKPSFVDYLRSGWSISVCGAIDYTGSNGDPKQTSSLHYLGGEN